MRQIRAEPAGNAEKPARPRWYTRLADLFRDKSEQAERRREVIGLKITAGYDFNGGPEAIRKLAKMHRFGEISDVAATSVIPENAECAVRTLHEHRRANELGFVVITTKDSHIRHLASELADSIDYPSG